MHFCHCLIETQLLPHVFKQQHHVRQRLTCHKELPELCCIALLHAFSPRHVQGRGQEPAASRVPARGFGGAEQGGAPCLGEMKPAPGHCPCPFAHGQSQAEPPTPGEALPAASACRGRCRAAPLRAGVAVLTSRTRSSVVLELLWEGLLSVCFA